MEQCSVRFDRTYLDCLAGQSQNKLHMFGRVRPNSKEILFHVKEVVPLLCLTFSSIAGMDTAGPSRVRPTTLEICRKRGEFSSTIILEIEDEP